MKMFISLSVNHPVDFVVRDLPAHIRPGKGTTKLLTRHAAYLSNKVREITDRMANMPYSDSDRQTVAQMLKYATCMRDLVNRMVSHQFPNDTFDRMHTEYLECRDKYHEAESRL